MSNKTRDDTRHWSLLRFTLEANIVLFCTGIFLATLGCPKVENFPPREAWGVEQVRNSSPRNLLLSMLLIYSCGPRKRANIPNVDGYPSAGCGAQLIAVANFMPLLFKRYRIFSGGQQVLLGATRSHFLCTITASPVWKPGGGGGVHSSQKICANSSLEFVVDTRMVSVWTITFGSFSALTVPNAR